MEKVLSNGFCEMPQDEVINASGGCIFPPGMIAGYLLYRGIYEIYKLGYENGKNSVL